MIHVEQPMSATASQLATLDAMKRAIEHAPRDPGRMAANLRGWWTPDGWYVCACCAGRIMARGCQLPQDSEPCWTDRAEPFGVCCLCE